MAEHLRYEAMPPLVRLKDIAERLAWHAEHAWTGSTRTDMASLSVDLMCIHRELWTPDEELLAASEPAVGPTTAESLVAAVAEALRDFKFAVGPNTLTALNKGQAVYLTPDERHQLAHAAVNAYEEATRDE